MGKAARIRMSSDSHSDSSRPSSVHHVLKSKCMVQQMCHWIFNAQARIRLQSRVRGWDHQFRHPPCAMVRLHHNEQPRCPEIGKAVLRLCSWLICRGYTSAWLQMWCSFSELVSLLHQQFWTCHFCATLIFVLRHWAPDFLHLKACSEALALMEGLLIAFASSLVWCSFNRFGSQVMQQASAEPAFHKRELLELGCWRVAFA